jgi:acetolactate synthase-1/2/3 large subunit
MRDQVSAVEAIRDTLPGALIVGDSTQPVYAANLWYDHDRPGGWFNAATGYGALGFGAPAAVGAALAVPDAPVVCLTGDGGLQFTLAELGSALDANAPVIFVVWNNRGYREIETSMRDAGVEPVGVSPAPPDFVAVAKAYGLAAERIEGAADLPAALETGARARRTGIDRDRRFVNTGAVRGKRIGSAPCPTPSTTGRSSPACPPSSAPR